MNDFDFAEIDDPFADQVRPSSQVQQNGGQAVAPRRLPTETEKSKNPVDDDQPDYSLPKIGQSSSSKFNAQDARKKDGNRSEMSHKKSVDGDADTKLQRYLSSLSDYDRSRYTQLKEKNEKLRSELKGIAQATEEIIRKEKERKQNKFHPQEDSELKRKQNILKDQQAHLNNLKQKIANKKRELDTAYQYPMIREKEDELRNLKRILHELTIERDSVLKVKKSQSKALNDLRYNKEEEARKQQLTQELTRIKRENKELTEKKMDLEKLMNRNHTRIVNGKQQIRDLKKRLVDFKKNNDGVDYKSITDQDVNDLKDKLKDLEQEKKNLEQNHILDLKNIERMKHELRMENARLDKILSEKDKEMRLNSIKMKELKRLQRHRALKPVSEKVDIEANDFGKHSQGVDAQSDEEEFEYVDDQKNDTKLNISQDDDVRNQENSRVKEPKELKQAHNQLQAKNIEPKNGVTQPNQAGIAHKETGKPNLGKPQPSVTENTDFPLLDPYHYKQDKPKDATREEIQKAPETSPNKPFERNMSKPNFSSNPQPLNPVPTQLAQNQNQAKPAENLNAESLNNKPSSIVESQQTKPVIQSQPNQNAGLSSGGLKQPVMMSGPGMNRPPPVNATQNQPKPVSISPSPVTVQPISAPKQAINISGPGMNRPAPVAQNQLTDSSQNKKDSVKPQPLHSDLNKNSNNLKDPFGDDGDDLILDDAVFNDPKKNSAANKPAQQLVNKVPEIKGNEIKKKDDLDDLFGDFDKPSKPTANQKPKEELDDPFGGEKGNKNPSKPSNPFGDDIDDPFGDIDLGSKDKNSKPKQDSSNAANPVKKDDPFGFGDDEF